MVGESSRQVFHMDGLVVNLEPLLSILCPSGVINPALSGLTNYLVLPNRRKPPIRHSFLESFFSTIPITSDYVNAGFMANSRSDTRILFEKDRCIFHFEVKEMYHQTDVFTFYRLVVTMRTIRDTLPRSNVSLLL